MCVLCVLVRVCVQFHVLRSIIGDKGCALAPLQNLVTQDICVCVLCVHVRVCVYVCSLHTCMYLHVLRSIVGDKGCALAPLQNLVTLDMSFNLMDSPSELGHLTCLQRLQELDVSW